MGFFVKGVEHISTAGAREDTRTMVVEEKPTRLGRLLGRIPRMIVTIDMAIPSEGLARCAFQFRDTATTVQNQLTRLGANEINQRNQTS